jgi:5'(3')-deoxyribonucleotidase
MLKIAVDFDEVLFPMLKNIEKYGLRKNKIRSKIPKSKRYEYNYAKLFSISDKESKMLVKNFYSSTEAYEAKPIDYSQEGIGKLSESGQLYIVTGRQNYKDAFAHTEYFLNTYYPDKFSDYFHTNSYSLSGPEKSKEELCRYLGVDYLIDDIPKNLDGINGILFGEYPWTSLTADVQHWKNWKQYLNECGS